MYVEKRVMTGTTGNKRVVVAMSGGVDSSVAAALLLQQGFEVIGVTMKTYEFSDVGGNVANETSCCGLDAFNDARMVAVTLGIPHYVVDFTEEFGRHVVENFVHEYLQGRTPNPCILCNKHIKWGALLAKAASLGASSIATGHYARLRFDEATGRYSIARPVDGSKDQTYALWGLDQAALARTMFPLGGLTKPDVRKIAASFGLKTATKEESYEICFVPDNDYRRFLAERRSEHGEATDGEILLDGKVVGKHRGYQNYTIGQRNGIGAFGERMYVTAIDPTFNTVTIGRGLALFRRELVARDMNLIGVDRLEDGRKVEAQVRYRDAAEPALIYNEGSDRVRVLFDSPKRAITPGQSVVFYDREVLLGGGVIERVTPQDETGRS